MGFELYCQLLKRSVQDLKGEKQLAAACSFQADFIHNSRDEGGLYAALTPRFIESDDQRLEFYRRFANAANYKEAIALAEELKDRYGALPEEVNAFVLSHRIRTLAAQIGFYSVEIKESRLFLEGDDGLYRENRKLPVLKKSGLKGLEETELGLRNIAKRFKIKIS